MPESKRRQQMLKNFDVEAQHNFEDAVSLLRKWSKMAKASSAVDIALSLGVDVKRSDQIVGGTIALPHGLGKPQRVAVFADGDDVQAAKDAGADVVGAEDLATKIKGGDFAYDVIIATPAVMRIVGQLGQILGPRKLMPSPKQGTVTTQVADAVKRAKAGQLRFRTDRAGIVHGRIGSLDFSDEALRDNLSTLIQEVKRMKPAQAKGIYMRKLTISSTQSLGVKVSLTDVGAAT